MTQPGGEEGQTPSHNELLSSRHVFMPDPIQVPETPDIDELRGPFRGAPFKRRRFSLGEPITVDGQRITLRIEPAKVNDKTNIKIDAKRKDGQKIALQGLPVVVHQEYDQDEHDKRMQYGSKNPRQKLNVCDWGLGPFYYGTLDDNGEMVVGNVVDSPESYSLIIPENEQYSPVPSVQEGRFISMPSVIAEVVVADAERYFEQTFKLADGSFEATMRESQSRGLIVDLATSKEWEGKIVPITVTRRPRVEANERGQGEGETHRYFMIPQYSDLSKRNIAALELKRFGKDEIILGLPVKPMESDELTEQDVVPLGESVKQCATDFSLRSWQKFLEENPGLPQTFRTAIQEEIRA